MSAKNLDSKGRLRNKIVSFRMSSQEANLLDDYVSVSGLNKQDYIIGRVLRTEITVNPGPRVYKGLRDKLNNVYSELCRIEKAPKLAKKHFVLFVICLPF